MVITPNNKKVFDFIVEYTAKQLFSPRTSEIVEGVGLSYSSVSTALRELIDGGYLEKVGKSTRGLKVIKSIYPDESL